MLRDGVDPDRLLRWCCAVGMDHLVSPSMNGPTCSTRRKFFSPSRIWRTWGSWSCASRAISLAVGDRFAERMMISRTRRCMGLSRSGMALLWLGLKGSGLHGNVSDALMVVKNGIIWHAFAIYGADH